MAEQFELEIGQSDDGPQGHADLLFRLKRMEMRARATARPCPAAVEPPTGGRGVTGERAGSCPAPPMRLAELARARGLEARQARPRSELPTLLTRLPIFLPARRSNQRELLDEENRLPFQTPWGAGHKSGPPLTVYDEDTLIALLNMRQLSLRGAARHLPVPVADVGGGAGADSESHLLHCTAARINAMCGQARGGKSNRLRHASVLRLDATVISFATGTGFVRKGTSFKFLDARWQSFGDESLFLIQFHPAMVRWLENEYTLIDLGLRMRLPPVGKAVHRFLSGQPRQYEIGTRKLQATVGHIGAHWRFLEELRRSLEILRGHGWVKEFTVDAVNRKAVYKLRLRR